MPGRFPWNEPEEDHRKKYTARYWRDRGEEARALARHMRDPEARANMLMIAQRYQRMADRSQRRERQDRRTLAGRLFSRFVNGPATES